MEISVYHFADGSEKVFVNGKETQKEKEFKTENISGAVYKAEREEDTQ